MSSGLDKVAADRCPPHPRAHLCPPTEQDATIHVHSRKQVLLPFGARHSGVSLGSNRKPELSLKLDLGCRSIGATNVPARIDTAHLPASDSAPSRYASKAAISNRREHREALPLFPPMPRRRSVVL